MLKGENNSKFQDWVGENALWALSHPGIPTHTEGSTRDRILLLPGADTPWELIPPESQWEHTENSAAAPQEEEFYAAATPPCLRIADHHPVTLTIKGHIRTSRPPVRTLRVSGLTKEEWTERNQMLYEELEKTEATLQAAHRIRNTARYLEIMMNAIKKVYNDKYTSKKAPHKDQATISKLSLQA